MTKVLFVCMGNICRSPTAEGVFLKMVRDAGLDIDGTKPAVAVGEDHDDTLAGSDHGLGRHRERFGAACGENDVDEHARCKRVIGIRERETRLDRARDRIDLGQDRLHGAREARAAESAPVSS